MAILLSYGGGKDSTALIAMDLERDKSAAWLGISREELDAKLPRFDAAVFADPGAEFAATYRTLDRVAALLGDRFVRVAKDGETIAEWCKRLGTVPVMPGGSHICSKKYKGDVLAAWAAREGHVAPVWLIGIEADEGHRVKRFTKPKGDAAEYRYPLVDLGLNRARIEQLLAFLGWPEVHKSSCVFCPFMSEGELRDMYHNDPDAWALAAEIEAAFREASPRKHGAWIDAGKPLNARGHAPRGMWRKDSYAEGARLFVKRIDGRQLSVGEWAERFEAESLIPLRMVA